MLDPNHILPQNTDNYIVFTNSTIKTLSMSWPILNGPRFASKTAAEHLSKRKLARVFNTIENTLYYKQSAIDEICKWEISIGFKFGPANPKIILFPHKKNITHSPQIYRNHTS